MNRTLEICLRRCDEHTEQNSAEILARPEAVERQNQFLKRAMFAAALLASAVFLMEQAKPHQRTIEAEQFILRDTTGKPRARLEMSFGNPHAYFG